MNATVFAILGALIAWLTAFATLKDSRPNRMTLLLPWQGIVTAFHQYRAAGNAWAGVDRIALSVSIRPILHLLVMLVIFATSGAYLFTIDLSAPPRSYEALLIDALALKLAMHAPCPWIRFVFVGERRKCHTPYTGPERRRHAAE